MLRITFSQKRQGNCNWSKQGEIITSDTKLKAIEDELENKGPINLEHWYFYGSSSPSRILFDDFEEFIEYLKQNASEGDSIHVWSFAETCNNKNQLVHGKCPNSNGLIPEGGAY